MMPGTRRSRKDGNIVKMPDLDELLDKLNELYESVIGPDLAHKAEVLEKVWRKLWDELLSACDTAETYCMFDHRTHEMLFVTKGSSGEKCACVYNEHEVKDLYDMLKKEFEEECE